MSSLVGRGAAVGRILPRLLRCGVVRGQGLPLVRSRGPEIQRIDERRWLSASAVPEQQEEEQDGAQQQQQQKEPVKKAPESNAWQELLDRKLHKLDMDVRRTGRAGLYDFENVLSNVEKGLKCTANQALLILRCCGSVLVDLAPDDRTKLLSETLSTFRKVEGLTFDVSHFNAMLKVHLENGNNVAASDFLQEMEEAAIVPNRVTFQHLIGLYCQGGNITGATTVLEHMKEEGMAINEAIFLSLLAGHCLKLDHESVNSTMGVMAASGLILGPETYAVAAATYGQAGNWAKVEEMMKKAEEAEVVLDDGDYLHIMVGCAKGGLHQQAQEHLIPKLPKKAGFFQEMRNTLPQLIHFGAIEAAMELYLGTPDTFAGGRGKNDRSEQGAFLLMAIVRTSMAPEEAMKVVERMKENGYTRAMEHLIENAVKHGDQQFCEKLGNFLKEKDLHPEKSMTPRETFLFLRRTVQTVQTSYSGMPRVIARLQNFRALGFALPQGVLSNEIIPHMIDLEKELPSETVSKLNRMIPGVAGGFSDLTNGTLQYLFNEEKQEECTAAVNYLLNGVKPMYVYPAAFSQSIVRSYLATGLMDHLVTCLWYLSRESLFGKHKETAFKALTCVPAVIHRYATEQNVEAQYKTILDALIKSKVGVPQEVGNQLVELEPGLKSLVEESSKVWDEGANYWTQEQEEKFLAQRRQMHLRAAKSVPKQNQPEPGSLEFLERGFNRSKSGELRKDLVARLITAYSQNNQPDKALETFNYAKKKVGFEMSAVEMDKVVNALIRAGRVEEALARVQATVDTDERVFSNTFIQVVLALVEAGEHERVIKVLSETAPGAFVNDKMRSNAMNIFYHYDKLGDDEKTSKIKEVLISSGWVEEGDRRMQAQLINQLLEKGDLQAVVEECERTAKEQKFIPNKMLVTKRLIEVENLELLQRVLDMSINLHGEELALYDLILSFLDLGRIPQAKKLIETPGLRYNQQKFEFMLKRFKQGQDLEALEALVRLSKNLHGCDRDFLYQELVTAFKDDMPRVEEAWLEIQEEGLAPSDQLKIKIANALEAGGREVPFEVPETYVKRETQTEKPKQKQKQEPAPPKKESSPEPAKKEKAQTQRAPPADKAETDRFIALIKSTRQEDLASLRAEIEAGFQSGAVVGGINLVTEKLVEKDLDEGAKLAAVVQNSVGSKSGIPAKFVKRTTGTIMKHYAEKNDPAKLDAFFDSLDAEQQKISQSMKESAHRLRKLLHEEDAYVDLVANDPNASDISSWVLSPGQLAKASPDLVTKLDTLAKGENQSAAIVLCKIALARKNQEMIDANWAHIKEDRPKKASVIFNNPQLSDLKGVISSMDAREKKDLIIEIISNGSNLTLAKIVEFTEEGMKGTNLTLEELPSNALKSLAKSKAFKEQATKILEAQKEEILSP